jgi:hypothetical protein
MDDGREPGRTEPLITLASALNAIEPTPPSAATVSTAIDVVLGVAERFIAGDYPDIAHADIRWALASIAANRLIPRAARDRAGDAYDRVIAAYARRGAAG